MPGYVEPKTNQDQNQDKTKPKTKKKSKQLKKKQIEKQAKTKPKTKKNKRQVCGVQIKEEAPGMMAKFVDAKARRLSDGDLQRVPFVSEPCHGEAAEVHAAVTKLLAFDADHHGQATSLWPALLLSAFPEFRDASNLSA